MLRLDSTGVVKALLHLHTWMRIVEALQETYSCSAISANSKENCHHSRWKRSSDIIRHHESDSDCQGNWHHRSLGNWLGFFRRCWHGGCCLSEGCSMYKTGCCKHRKGTACSRSLDVMWWSAQRSRLQPTSPHLCSAIPRNMRAKWIDDNWCAVKVQWRVMDWDRDEHKFEWQRPSLLLSASEAAEQWLSRVLWHLIRPTPWNWGGGSSLCRQCSRICTSTWKWLSMARTGSISEVFENFETLFETCGYFWEYDKHVQCSSLTGGMHRE